MRKILTIRSSNGSTHARGIVAVALATVILHTSAVADTMAVLVSVAAIAYATVILHTSAVADTMAVHVSIFAIAYCTVIMICSITKQLHYLTQYIL
jgi:hypothetical protein